MGIFKTVRIEYRFKFSSLQNYFLNFDSVLNQNFLFATIVNLRMPCLRYSSKPLTRFVLFLFHKTTRKSFKVRLLFLEQILELPRWKECPKQPILPISDNLRAIFTANSAGHCLSELLANWKSKNKNCNRQIPSSHCLPTYLNQLAFLTTIDAGCLQNTMLFSKYKWHVYDTLQLFGRVFHLKCMF